MRSVLHTATDECNKQKPKIGSSTVPKGEIGFAVRSGIKWFLLFKISFFSPRFLLSFEHIC